MLFEKSTGKILSRWKFILQLIGDLCMKKVSLENVVVNCLFHHLRSPSSVENVMKQDATRCMCITCKKQLVAHVLLAFQK